MDEHGQPADSDVCQCCFDELRIKVGEAGEEDEPINYVEYRVSPQHPWQPSGYCEDCLRHLMSLKYKEYLEKVKAADCGRSLRNMLSQGPPLFIRDSTALPTNTEEDDSDSSDTTKADQPDSAADDSTTSTTTSSSTSPKPTASSTQMDVDRALSTANEVKELWFASSKSVEPAKVDHALEGTERLKLWRQLIVDNKDRLDNKGGLDALEARLQQLLEGDDKSVK